MIPGMSRRSRSNVPRSSQTNTAGSSAVTSAVSSPVRQGQLADDLPGPSSARVSSRPLLWMVETFNVPSTTT